MRFLLQCFQYLVKKFLRYSTCEKIVTRDKAKATNKAENMLNNALVIVSEPMELTSITTKPKLSIVKKEQVKSIDIQWLRDFIKEQEIKIEARDYQERIIVKTINHILVDGIDSILVEAPTGAGKTVLGLTICRILKHLLGYSSSWSTARRNLLNQTAKVDVEKNFGVKPTLVSMFEKSPQSNDVLVVDEAHKDATSSMANIHSCVSPKIVILLSATPFRSDRAVIFHRKSVKDAGIRSLIRDGYLSSFHHFAISEYTPASVAKTYLRDPERWGKSVFFFHTLQQCETFKRLLANAGVECELVTANSNREEQLARFESGKISCLVNMLILCEGFDFPPLKTVWVRDSGKLTTIQMAGRVLRLHEGQIKQIVQSSNTRYPFSREATPKAKFLWSEDEGGYWKNLELNPLVNQMLTDTLTQLAAKATEEPDSDSKKLIEHLKKKRLIGRSGNPSRNRSDNNNR